MNSLKNTLVLGLAGAASAAAVTKRASPEITYPQGKGCGEVNIIFTGFPAFHPSVAAQGFNTTEVDIALRTDAIQIVKAGYNLQVIFQGQEEPVSNIGDRMQGLEWGAAVTGFGIRGAADPVIVTRFEDNLSEFRENQPWIPLLFNWSPTSTSTALKARIPLVGDCTDTPGTLIAYEEVCAPDVCPSVTVITDGNLDELSKGL